MSRKPWLWVSWRNALNRSVPDSLPLLLLVHLIKVRQALKIMITEKEPLRLTDDKKTIADYKVKMDAHIILRDIGPQIGYRDVCVLAFALS